MSDTLNQAIFNAEKWLEGAPVLKNVTDFSPKKRVSFRQRGRFVESPNVYIEAMEFYGALGGYISRSTVRIVWLDKEISPDCTTDEMRWNVEVCPAVRSPLLLQTDRFYLVTELASHHLEAVSERFNSLLSRV